MKHSKIDILENTPIPYSILQLALPSVLSMMVNILYNLTDTFFIGKLNDPFQVAAVSLAFPLFAFQMAIAGIFGVGGGSYLSRLLGKKDYAMARETTSTAMFSSGVISLFMGLFGLLLIPQFLRILGASGQTAVHAYRYMFILILGSPIVLLNLTLTQLLRAEGAAKTAMMGLFIGTGANILLDPLFIFGFKMGVTGAAIATLAGQALGLAYYVAYYLGKKSLAAPSHHYLHFRWECYKQIFIIGIPSSLSQIMMGIGSSLSFNLASVYGDHAIAAMGVAHRVFSIPIFVFIGISVGVQALIGFNYGARNYARMKKAIRTSVLISLLLSVGFTLLFALFPRVLVATFINDPKIIEIGVVILEAYVFAIPFAALGMVMMVSLQAMGKALPAFIVALSRQGFAYIPAILVLNRLYAFKGLVFALPLADMVTTLISFSFVYTITKRLKNFPLTQKALF